MEERITPTNIIQSQQILLPKKVYIGDTAELRCNFNSPSAFINQLTEKGTTDISINSFIEPLDSQEYEILQVKISNIGVNYYQLSVIFKSWKTGIIRIPAIQIDEALIEFQPISIVSITEQNNTTVLKDSLNPFLLPGTTYKLYGILILFVIIILTVIRIIIKREKIRFYLNNKRLIRKYKKNKKTTIKKLTALSKETLTDKEFAEKYQHLMRNYLEIRFDFSFTKAVSSEFMAGFMNTTGNTVSELKQEAFGDIVSTFVRTDYIRYKDNSVLLENEKENLCSMVIEKIEILEKSDDDGGFSKIA